MSAKQVSSGYILWKTGPEPVRHSHRERARLLTVTPTGIGKAHRRQVSSGRGIRRRRQYGGEQAPSASARSKEILRDSAVGGKLFQPAPAPKKRLENSAEKAGLFQLVSVPKRFPGAVQEEADYPRQVCSKKHLRNSVGKVRLLQVAPVPKKLPGQGRLAALVPKRPSGGTNPQTHAQKNTRKVIGPSGCSVM